MKETILARTSIRVSFMVVLFGQNFEVKLLSAMLI